MSINVEATPENRALAAAVEARMAADSRIVNAKAAMWRLAGIGGVVALTGAGLGAAFFGYSYITDSKSAADKIAAALVSALDKTTLKTSGEVKLAENTTVALSNTTVKLDPNSVVRNEVTVKLDPDATVKLDRNARLNMVGGDIPRPSLEQLRANATSSTGAAVVTDFTVFKNVKFGQGTVTTGWKFSSNSEATPNFQFCYYMQDSELDSNTSVRVSLAENERLLRSLKPQRAFNVPAAVANCQWFSGGQTIMN